MFKKLYLTFTREGATQFDLYLLSKWPVNCDTRGDYGVLKGVLVDHKSSWSEQSQVLIVVLN